MSAGPRQNPKGRQSRTSARQRANNLKQLALTWYRWSGRRDSNPRPSPWQGDALPLRHFRVGHHFIAGVMLAKGGVRTASTWGSRPYATGTGHRFTSAGHLARLPCMRQDENTAILSRSFGEVAHEYNRLRSGPSKEALDWLVPRECDRRSRARGWDRDPDAAARRTSCPRQGRRTRRPDASRPAPHARCR